MGFLLNKRRVNGWINIIMGNTEIVQWFDKPYFAFHHHLHVISILYLVIEGFEYVLTDQTIFKMVDEISRDLLAHRCSIKSYILGWSTSNRFWNCSFLISTRIRTDKTNISRLSYINVWTNISILPFCVFFLNYDLHPWRRICDDLFFCGGKKIPKSC